MTLTKKLWVALIAVAIIAIVALFLPVRDLANLGVSCLSDSVTCFTAVDTTDGYSVDGTTVISGTGAVTVGANGSTVNEFIASKTNCNFRSSTGDLTFEATTTASYSCAVTGVTVNDVVLANLPTTTPATTQGTVILAGVSASSTDGYVEFKLVNQTGATVTLGPTTIGSSTNLMVVDN